MINLATSTIKADNLVGLATQATQGSGTQDQSAFGHALSKRMDVKKDKSESKSIIPQVSNVKTKVGNARVADTKFAIKKSIDDQAQSLDAPVDPLISNLNGQVMPDMTNSSPAVAEPIKDDIKISASDSAAQAIFASLGQGSKLELIAAADVDAAISTHSSTVKAAGNGSERPEIGNPLMAINVGASPISGSSASFPQGSMGFMDAGVENNPHLPVGPDAATLALQASTEMTQAPVVSPMTGNIQAQSSTSALDTTVKTPFGSSAWTKEIGQKMVWMVRGADQSATLTLNPPDLGPLKIVIHVNNDMVNTAFISNNSEVRQSLQDGLENLRQSMAQSGITLGQTNVNSGSEQSQSAFEQAFTSNKGLASGVIGSSSNQYVGNSGEATVLQRQFGSQDGLVNTFA